VGRRKEVNWFLSLPVIAGGDWVIDIGPGAGDKGGTIVASGKPSDIVKDKNSRTTPYLAGFL